jgi:hypothetical protein
MSISLLSGFPRRYLESGVLLGEKKGRGSMSRDEHVPASDGTDTTGLHGVEMIHDRGMYGFNFFARYAVCGLARRFWLESQQGIRTSA